MRLLLLALCFLLFGTDLCSQSDATWKILWYNTENLFHPSDDSLAGDDDFIPGGIRGWTMNRYRDKLTAIARVIIASGGWDPPQLVGLCEVENAHVLEDLVQHPILLPWNYHYIHQEGPGHRGTEVALLFRDPDFRIIRWDCLPPPVMHGMEGNREILYVRGCLGSKDSLDLFLCHFISKYRGSGASAMYRIKQAQLLRQTVDSLCKTRVPGPVVLTGDFNDSWEAHSLAPLREAGQEGVEIRPLFPSNAAYTYKYQGKWMHLDMFLLAGETGTCHFSTEVLSLAAMLIPDKAWGGWKPFRTYEGMQYRGGFSDHLPLLLELSPGKIPPATSGRRPHRDH